MKKITLLICVLFLIHITNAQHLDKWSFVSVMPPDPDSTRQLSTGFSINGIGYIGLGMNPGGATYKDFYRLTYSPSFNLDVWAPVSDFPYETYDVNSFGIGSKGYVFTSLDASNSLSNKLYEYDAVLDAWTIVSAFPGAVRQGASCFVINNKAYIISGWDGSAGSAVNEVWEYDPANNQWTQKNNFPGTARFRAIAFSIDNLGYFGTGYNSLSQKQNDFWKYDVVNDSWIQLGNIPCGPRAEAAAFASEGRGYLSTGMGGSMKNDLWEYYPSLDKWIEKQPFPGFSRTNCAGYSIGIRGYVGNGFGANQNSIWAFMPGNLAVSGVNAFNYCSGDTLNIEYISYNQTFAAGNIFNVELADASLSFTNPVVIGTITSTADHGFITTVIPQGLSPLGNYRIRITSSNPALVSGMNSYYFYINETPQQPTISTNGDTLISSALSGNQWYDDNGPISGATNQQFVPSAPGNYYVIVSNGICSSLPSSIVSGIHDLTIKNNFTVSPNPSKGIFFIQSDVVAEFSVSNNIGQIIYKSKSAKGTKSIIDISDFPAGIYYLNYSEEQTSERKTQKLVLIK